MNEMIEELLEKLADGITDQIAQIQIKASPLGVEVTGVKNEGNIHRLADFLEMDEKDIEEIVKVNAKKMAVELNELIMKKTIEMISK